MARRSRVEFRPDTPRVERALRGVVRRAGDRTKANRRVAVFLDRWVQRNFRSEGGEFGGWTPFKLGGRRVRGGGIDTSAKLLQHTGRLRVSFRPFYNRRDAGIGSDLPYAEHHEEGTQRLPQRRMLPVAAKVQDDVVRIHEEQLRTVTGRRLW